MAASTALPTMAFPTEAPEETLLATTPEELPPVIDPIPVPETPSQNSFGVVPDDIKNTMQGIRSLASDLILQAYNINGDGVKVQIVGNTYLGCLDMVDGIQEVSGKIGRPPTMLFSWEDQTSICSAFDAFGILQSKLIAVLSMEPQSIVRDGFVDQFEECFAQLKPALSKFIQQLIVYTPTCETEMLRRIDQLDVAFSNARVRLEDGRHG
ncbi:hypothetical protein ACLX1H_010952 [Fusarium chlamydosporum]